MPSYWCIIISFASTKGFIITSLELLAISSNAVPPSAICTLPPSASNVISPATSTVKSPVPSFTTHSPNPALSLLHWALVTLTIQPSKSSELAAAVLQLFIE